MTEAVAVEAVLGVHFAAGVAYLALVRRARELVLDDPVKVEVSATEEDWEALQNFAQRFAAVGRAANVVSVGFAEPKKYQNWGYRDAYTRSAPQVAAGLALRAAGIVPLIVPQATAAKSLGTRLADLDAVVTERYRPADGSARHWTQRVPAVAVAMHLAIGRWP